MHATAIVYFYYSSPFGRTRTRTLDKSLCLLLLLLLNRSQPFAPVSVRAPLHTRLSASASGPPKWPSEYTSACTISQPLWPSRFGLSGRETKHLGAPAMCACHALCTCSIGVAEARASKELLPARVSNADRRSGNFDARIPALQRRGLSMPHTTLALPDAHLRLPLFRCQPRPRPRPRPRAALPVQSAYTCTCSRPTRPH